MILPDGFENMTTKEEIADALVREGMDREDAEVYAAVWLIPDEWFEENDLFLM